ncbi:MAG TPA: hypothetical protein VG839_08315 [Asticcacaulis sp.]|nr:hypothetical protein [Asticcacaulis sp.]
MEHWRAIYAPALSASIRTIAWYPLWCDTPRLVSDLAQASFCYSGGALLAFDNGAEVFLTWTQAGGQFSLSASNQAERDWIPNCLDRVQCGWEEPWRAVRGAQLLRICLYANASDDQLRIVGARHELITDGAPAFVWIACGGEKLVGDADDLWVGIDVEPDNLSSLVEVLSF